MKNSTQISGTTVAVGIDPDGPLVGALLLGAPGTGKSSLALGIIAACRWNRSCLISDDRVDLRVEGGALIASGPDAIKGLIEVRGFGPAPIKSATSVRLTAVFDLDRPTSRVPNIAQFEALGATLPMWPFLPSPGSESRIPIILRTILAGQTP